MSPAGGSGKGPRKAGRSGQDDAAYSLSLRPVLGKLLEHLRLASEKQRDISARWREVAGDELAKCTRVASLRAGILTVEVNSAAALHELSVYYKADFLKLLRERFPGGLNELKFRLAPTEDELPFKDSRPRRAWTAEDDARAERTGENWEKEDDGD